jgi:hypothetical protein
MLQEPADAPPAAARQRARNGVGARVVETRSDAV